MPLDEKKTFQLYRHLNVAAVLVCIYLAIFVSPLKVFFLPHLHRFITVNIDAIINILVITFMAGSLCLMFMVWWINFADKNMKRRVSAYMSQMVAKDYYRGNKRIDFYRAVKTSLSKYSRDDPAEVGHDVDKKNVAIGRADKTHRKFQEFKARRIREEEKEDKSDGTRKLLYPNGVVKKEVTYKDGKIEGIYKTFYEDGTLHQEMHYKNGLLNGVYKACDEFGIPYFEITYRDGIKHGVEKGYYKSGVVEYEEEYIEGNRVSRKSYDEGGELRFKHVLPILSPEKEKEGL